MDTTTLRFVLTTPRRPPPYLEANGVTMLSEEMDDINRRLRFFEGPEGITLELVESGPTRATTTAEPGEEKSTRDHPIALVTSPR